jgi:hypothetical protein
MDFFLATELTIPVSQMVLLLLLTTLVLLFGRVKLALLTNYLFALYWGYVVNRELLLGSAFEKGDYYITVYFGFGLAVAILALIGFFVQRE